MRTFIIRARKGTTRWERIRSQIGTKEHFEIVAHSIMNAFFVSNDFRKDVEVYVVLDSAEDFPHTLKLSGATLSLSGFHEEAIIELIEKALKDSAGLKKDDMKELAPGLQIYGFGFEKLIGHLIKTHTVYLLEPKGEDIRTIPLAENPVYILSDHLAMPKKIVDSLKRRGLQTLSLGKKMLFASQCVVIINHEMDRLGL